MSAIGRNDVVHSTNGEHSVSTRIVSAVIVNRNGAEHLRMCLPSLREQSYQAIELIVVDNASSDDSAAVTREHGAKWLPLSKNVGLAPALNRGAAIAIGEFLLFINNDMRFDRDFVARLIEVMVNDDSVFGADGMQFNWDGTVQGHLATRLVKGRHKDGSNIELVPGLDICQEAATAVAPVFMGSAASMLVRRSFFEKLGGMDNDIPMGYEDADICWRAWVNGWKTVYVPDAVCWHRVGSSCQSLEGSLFLFEGVLKGRLKFATKLLPVRYALVTWIISAAGVIKDVRQSRWRFAWKRINVLAEFSAKIPQFLRAKSALYRGGEITPANQVQTMLRLAENEPK